MQRSLSQLSLGSLVVGLALTLGGCPVYLEDYSDEYDHWWDDCPDDPSDDCAFDDCPDAGTPVRPDGGREDGGGGDRDGGPDTVEPECQRNADCGEGSCQAGICIDLPPTSCVYHSDCGVGFACDSDACEPAPVCGSDADCEAGLACDGRRTCVGPEPVGCALDAQCGEQARCIFGACQSSDDDVCQFNHDCGPGRACVDQACTPLCSGQVDCPSGTLCSEGLCLPASADECVLSSQCEGGHCVEGHCLTDCQADQDCAEGLEVCGDDGLCRPDIAPRPFCVDDEECATGHVCVEGVCRTPCPGGTNDECQRFDSQLPICADNGLCYSMAETDPECEQSSDCPEGQRCVDAMCRN